MKRNACLIISSLILSVIIGEGLLQVLGLPKFYQVYSFPEQFKFTLLKSGELFYTNYPLQTIIFKYDGNTRGYFDEGNVVGHTTNALGFRGNTFLKDKKTNAVRIAFLGDSFTFGEGVKDKDIFSRKIEDYLNETRSDKIYECMNFGVGGYNTSQSLFLLKNLVVDFKPDIVVLGYTLNDIEPKLFHYDNDSKSVKRWPREAYVPELLPNQTPPDTALYRLRIARLLWQLVNNRDLSNKTIDYYTTLYKQKNLWEANEKSLLEFIEVCKIHKIKCYITVLPLLYHLEKKYPFSHLHQIIENTISNGDVYIHMLPTFIGRKAVDLWVHPTDQHPNEIAHALIAERIGKRISGDLEKQAQ